MVGFIFLTSPLFALDKARVAEFAQFYGFWTLLPPVLAIALAFITKNVILSLFIGVFSGTFLLELKGAGISPLFLRIS